MFACAPTKSWDTAAPMVSIWAVGRVDRVEAGSRSILRDPDAANSRVATRQIYSIARPRAYREWRVRLLIGLGPSAGSQMP